MCGAVWSEWVRRYLCIVSFVNEKFIFCLEEFASNVAYSAYVTRHYLYASISVSPSRVTPLSGPCLVCHSTSALFMEFRYYNSAQKWRKMKINITRLNSTHRHTPHTAHAYTHKHGAACRSSFNMIAWHCSSIWLRRSMNGYVAKGKRNAELSQKDQLENWLSAMRRYAKWINLNHLYAIAII